VLKYKGSRSSAGHEKRVLLDKFLCPLLLLRCEVSERRHVEPGHKKKVIVG